MSREASTSDVPTQEAAVADCWNEIGVNGDGTCVELEKHTHCRNCPIYSTAGAELLDRPPPSGYIDECTAFLALPKAEEALGTASALLFRIGKEILGLESDVLREVSEIRPIHSLPHGKSKVLKGLVSIHGEILVCVSLGELLGLEEGTVTRGIGERVFERLLVVGRKESRFVFPASEVHGFQHYSPEELKAPPATLAHATPRYTRAILCSGERTIALLDAELVLEALMGSIA